jgi:hypothetical protein
MVPPIAPNAESPALTALPPIPPFPQTTDRWVFELINNTNLEKLQNLLVQTSFPKEQLGGKPLQHLERWEATCGGQDFMRFGMTPDWMDEDAPSRLQQLFQFSEYKASVEKENAYDLLLQEEIAQNIVVQIHHNAVRFYNKTHVVPKKGNKWRKVLNCQIVNSFQKDIHFKMEGPEDIIRMAQRFDWASLIDLKNAFNHLIVHPSLQPFLSFSFRGKSYMYRAMPFGAKHAPRLFTKALSFAIMFIRANWNVRIIAYMDDILLLHQDPHYLRVATLQIVIYLQSLGWTMSLSKCELIPKQEITFLGWIFNFASLSMRMTKEMQHSLLNTLRDWIPKAYNGSIQPTRSLASLIGSLSFLRAQLPRAGLYLRALHTNLTNGVLSNGWN